VCYTPNCTDKFINIEDAVESMEKKETVYLESSVISYFTARASRDVVVLAHQQITMDWWETSQNRYEFYISEIVKEEVSRGDPCASSLRMTFIDKIPHLKLSVEIETIAEMYINELNIPKDSIRDALHIAIACFHKVDYLVTWNCTHIANAHTIKKLYRLNQEHGLYTPVICTPEELIEVV
jgi:hypothetical protein